MDILLIYVHIEGYLLKLNIKDKFIEHVLTDVELQNELKQIYKIK